MTRHSLRRAGAVLLLLAFALAAAVVPQLSRPHVTAAQTVQTTTPLNLCGTLQAYSQTAVTFTTNGTNVTYNIANPNTFTVQQSQIGQNLCFVGQLNSQNQIVSGTLTPNYTTTVVLCGVVNTYNAATTLTTGFLSIGTTSLPVGINATFTGTIVVGQNLCINGQVNALGQLISGTVTANGGAAPVIPTSACGTLTAYTGPTSGANGTITITTPTVVFGPYTIVAGSTINPSTGPGALQSSVCLVGTLNGGGQLTSATFTPNSAQAITLCGVVSAYTPSTASQNGSLTINGLVVPLAVSATFTGQTLVLQSNVCIQGTFNGLGQLVTGSVGNNPNAPTATPTVTLTATATATGTAVPPTATPTVTNTPAAATATATATNTPVPPTATATNTPVPPTATPTPKPAKKYRAAFGYLSVWYHFIRVGTQETVVVQAKKHVEHGIWLTVRFPSGKYYAYYTNTDKNGFWSVRFTVPAAGKSRFTSEAVVTAQLWYRSTTSKSYATFFLV